MLFVFFNFMFRQERMGVYPATLHSRISELFMAMPCELIVLVNRLPRVLLQKLCLPLFSFWLVSATIFLFISSLHFKSVITITPVGKYFECSHSLWTSNLCFLMLKIFSKSLKKSLKIWTWIFEEKWAKEIQRFSTL